MDSPTQYEFPSGLHFVRLYPVEGESAIAEIWQGEEVVGELIMRGIHLEEIGDRRVADATIDLTIFSPNDSDRWTFALDDFLAISTVAKTWLKDNERDRTPIEGDLTAAGAAFEKVSTSDPLWHPERQQSGSPTDSD